MASAFSAVDLSQLPAPAVLELVDYEQIVREIYADFVNRFPDFTAFLESDPVSKLVEAFAYREMVKTQEWNDKCLSVFLAFAKGTDLDHIGANYSVPRLVIVEAQPTAIPPVAAVYEDDTAYRQRIQMAFQGYSVAGPEGAYVVHAMGADGRVKDISAISPEPGVVSVYVLSHEAGGIASDEVLDNVAAALNDRSVRPLTDQVGVYAASVIPYEVTAHLQIERGPDASVILSAARKAVQAYTDSVAKLGREVALSGLYKALHQGGVIEATLTSPAATIEVSPGQAAYCTGITLTFSEG